MAQSHAGGGSIQQTLQQNVDAEPVPLKRKKKDSGAPAGKSVVVLKSSNVTMRNDSVFMPNTIEMAQLKKKEKGQFLTNVQISSKMTQQDIKELLISLFPYLGDQRFYCASAVDNRTRLDFHGELRIWDGGLIKQKIKGNSALYIYTDEGSLGKQDSTSSKQSTLKRPHDQMTPTMQGECRIDKGGDVSIMTQGGILAQSGMTQNTVSIASQSQSRKPTMHIVDGQAEGRNTIPSKSSLLPHTNLQGMVSSSLLTHQLNILNITSAASEQERGQLGQTAGGYDSTQGGITCNSTAQSKPGSVVSAEIDQCAGKRGSVSNAAGAHQEEAGTSESDFESPSSDSALERPSDSGIEGSDNLFVDDKSSGTGFEPVLTGISVPGNLENTLCVEILEPDDKKDLPSDGGPSTASMVNDTSMLDLASEEISFSEELAYIPDVGTSVFGGVQDIFPPCGSVKGGFEFRISLNEALPDQFESGWAWFDKVAIVPVDKLNPFTLSGTVPRSEVTGDVLVGVLTDSFQELGNTLFKYIDDGENTLKQFIQDPVLQAKYFTMLAGNLANGIPTFGSHFAQALGPMNVLLNGSSIQAKQEQSIELLQLMVYTAAQTGAQRFIEMVFSTSAGQVVFCSYKDRNPLPEDVARANGHEELAQYLQGVHTRLSLDKNVHSTVIDWLELLEAVQKQYLTTQDESPIGLDQSDEDDDDSSDYFADAETSSCGSCDDDSGWPEISEKKDVSIMPQGGIPAQTGMTENIVSTASELQIRKPTMHIADRQAVGRNTNPSKSSLLAHTDLQGIVSSSLIPEWNSLNITGAASEQEIGPLWQTAAGGYDLAHVPLESTTKQAQAQRGSVSNAAGAHQENAGTSESDFEWQSSDSAVERPSDSGIKGSDNLFVNDGHEDGNGVYGIIRDLIVEGKDARFVNKKGRYVVNWSRALDCFTDYKAKKNPQFKSKAVSRRKISNGFRSALLNYYKKEGAKEYKDAKKVNENDEVVERQFQMPPRLFKSMFREAAPTITEDSEEDDQEDTSNPVSSEGVDKPQVSHSTSTSDTGFDEFMDMSSHEIVEPLGSSSSVAGNMLTDLGLDVIKTEGEETSIGLCDVQLSLASEVFDPSMLDSAIEEICSDGISDDISDEGIDLLGVEPSPTMSRFSSSTMVKKLTIDETVNIEMPESADTVSSIEQSHPVAGSVQGSYTAVSCVPCSHGDYRCQRCEKCSSCRYKDVLVNCSFNSLLQDTRDRKITSLESPPIYKMQPYKLLMCDIPTVVNIGDGLHFRIFVAMMPGEYDTILEWPFCGRIVLTFKDQSTDVNSRCSVQGSYTAVSCIPCGHGDYRCQRCEKFSSCGYKDVLVNCSINGDAVCSKSCKSKTHYFNESDGQCYSCTEFCGMDETNIEPVPLKRKEKDSGAPAGKRVVVLKSSDVTAFMPNTIEVAQLKKKEKEQFVTNVQISSRARKLKREQRYPRLPMELSVEVYRMRYDVYEMRSHRHLDRGVRLQINESTRAPACQDGTRYSVEETNQFHGQTLEDERMSTFSLPRLVAVRRLSPPELMSSLGRNCGGKYIWKINPFSRLLQDARDGKITSLESPPIYTSQQEYKFFMHVFPKGVNSGDGRHIGIFVGMMQGEYDTILEWPFCGRIVFTFKDQSTDVNGFRHDISDTFMANRNLSAFQEPTAAGQYSTLYGYAEFALTALVCSPPYLKDDTVMIVIEIHNNTSTFPCKEAQRLGCKNSMN